MRYFLFYLVFLFSGKLAYAAPSLHMKDVYLTSGKLSFDLKKGTIDYLFKNGVSLKNTVAYVDLVQHGIKVSAQFDRHDLKEVPINDSIGKGRHFQFIHEDHEGITLVQSITVYEDSPYLLLRVEATKDKNTILETRHISPLAILEASEGSMEIPWKHPILVDLPFDNDNWTKLLAQPLPEAGENPLDGVSHELAFIYDKQSYQGLVVGSLEHDFWKTGIRYHTASKKGTLESFVKIG